MNRFQDQTVCLHANSVLLNSITKQLLANYIVLYWNSCSSTVKFEKLTWSITDARGILNVIDKNQGADDVVFEREGPDGEPEWLIDWRQVNLEDIVLGPKIFRSQAWKP